MNAKITPDIADLPPELVKQLSRKAHGPGNGSTTKKLVALVEAATQPLNLDQLLIGMYRAHGEILKRKNVIFLMHYAVKCGCATRIDNGVYGPPTRENPT